MISNNANIITWDMKEIINSIVANIQKLLKYTFLGLELTKPVVIVRI